ncbi:biotin-[acetyl-CoA-carboxylase] ligase, putative [Eimeria necatrix]|uniref:Biotin-[acetyl-CoA-carboxylase] ligase, putative n=1 Tax=Eimeria necatrix TaxID=51315 RepID=U6MM35_9EIME|nr:biotin-[acetyl-CoA-carboxylase] ligase, putative [Eimeria necatrix]CDJ65312.1 biotin-[acetyl-CoA-carboxylase] ligase, putative [Eimeria necatrix]
MPRHEEGCRGVYHAGTIETAPPAAVAAPTTPLRLHRCEGIKLSWLLLLLLQHLCTHEVICSVISPTRGRSSSGSSKAIASPLLGLTSRGTSPCGLQPSPHTEQQQQLQALLHCSRRGAAPSFSFLRPRPNNNGVVLSNYDSAAAAAASAEAAATAATTVRLLGTSPQQPHRQIMQAPRPTPHKTAAAGAGGNGLCPAAAATAEAADVPVSAAKVRNVWRSSLNVTELSFFSLDSTQKWAERHLDELVCAHLLQHLQQQKQQQKQALATGGHCLCVTAAKQTAGVGTRRGDTGEERRWVSAAGNLHATYLLPWKQQQQQLLLHLPFVAALSVQRVLQQLGVKGSKIKWVNDVLVNNKKIAGVLCQSTNRTVAAAAAAAAGNTTSEEPTAKTPQLQAVEDMVVLLLGIGINLAAHPKEHFEDCCYQGSTDVKEALQQQQQHQKRRQQVLLEHYTDLVIWPPQSSLLLASNSSNSKAEESSDGSIDVSVEKVLDLLHEEVGEVLLLLQQQGSAPLLASVDEHLAYKGDRVSVILEKQEQQELMLPQRHKQQQQQGKYSGILEGLDCDGSLLLRLPDGSLRSFSSGRLMHLLIIGAVQLKF